MKNLKVGDKVEIYLNKSKLHSGYFGLWVDGEVVGFTAKKIKIDEHLYTISLDVQEKFCTVFWVTRVYPVIL